MTITSFPAEHPPIAPAVGYRVDCRVRSVEISGDTRAEAHGRLPRLDRLSERPEGLKIRPPVFDLLMILGIPTRTRPEDPS